jgi:hypothetical protein
VAENITELLQMCAAVSAIASSMRLPPSHVLALVLAIRERDTQPSAPEKAPAFHRGFRIVGNWD